MIFACLIALLGIGASMAYVVAFGMGAPSLAMGGGEFAGSKSAPLDAGLAPAILIDDPDTHVFISTSTDGKVRLLSTRSGCACRRQATLNIVAATNDGHISAGSAFRMTGASGHKTGKLGEGAGSVAVTTGEGSIHLETTGAL